MQAQVLVPLKPHQRVDELVPYLELLAPAGSTVVFLIPIATNLFPWWSEALTAPVSELKNSITTAVLAPHVARERQLQRLQARGSGAPGIGGQGSNRTGGMFSTPSGERVGATLSNGDPDARAAKQKPQITRHIARVLFIPAAAPRASDGVR